MISFPILNQLEISDYGLYPGKEESPGLRIEFAPGLTLILGTNGLGKTTLVTILFRLLSGPNDISRLSDRSSELGNNQLEIAPLSKRVQRTFSARVADGATDAVASLSVSFGPYRMEIVRNLRDMSLLSLSVDNVQQDLDEKSFQNLVIQLSGLENFGDWLLILRYLVFYLEERRALVWDPSAQKHLLRCLFLTSEVNKEWLVQERRILAMDTRMRNIQAVLFSQEQSYNEVVENSDDAADSKEELSVLESLQDRDLKQRESLSESLLESDPSRHDCRLRVLSLQQERESRMREVEHARMTALQVRFPSRSDTAKFILTQLILDEECLACGNTVPDFVQELNRRISDDECVVCSTPLHSSENVVPAPSVADRRVEKAEEELSRLDGELETALAALQEVELCYSESVREISEIEARISKRRIRVDALIRRLPPAEEKLHKQRTELAHMRAQVETYKADLVEFRSQFSSFVDAQAAQVLKYSSEIKKCFESIAGDFLFEGCRLTWAPQRRTIGQGGHKSEFPAFQLEMTGTDFGSNVLRSGPEQVSESQREFIDLAFRMALMKVAGREGAGSLVIDAPESSLDAVFVERAAAVLATFAQENPKNRLLVASNLVEGRLIPELIAKSWSDSQSRRGLVNLLDIAEPTAAVKNYRQDYEKVFDSLVLAAESQNT